MMLVSLLRLFVSPSPLDVSKITIVFLTRNPWLSWWQIWEVKSLVWLKQFRFILDVKDVTMRLTLSYLFWLINEESSYFSRPCVGTCVSGIKIFLFFEGFIKQCNLIQAKVPILKFCDQLSGVECDLNVNNVIGVYNTHLLAMYARGINKFCKCRLLSSKKWLKSLLSIYSWLEVATLRPICKALGAEDGYSWWQSWTSFFLPSYIDAHSIPSVWL